MAEIILIFSIALAIIRGQQMVAILYMQKNTGRFLPQSESAVK
jgi:hypothetical protein